MLFFLVGFILLFVYFHNLGLNQVWQPNEAFYAYGAKKMLDTGNFLTPEFNGEVRLNKPPMTYWVVALSFAIFGVNEFALRFLHAVLGLGTGVLTYLIGKEITDRSSALLSSVVFLTSFLFVANSRYASPEVVLTFFITLTLYLWLKGYRKKNDLITLLSFVSSAMAVLTKGPVGFVMPALIVFVYLLITDRKEILRPIYYIGSLLTLVLSGWWYLYQLFENGEVFTEVFFKENIKRVYGLEADPFYQYFIDIPVSFLPYSFLVYLALPRSFRDRGLLFPVVWFLSFLVVFSLVRMKLPVYIMPAFPAMALITGAFLNCPAGLSLKVSLLTLGFLQIVAMWAGGFMFGGDLVLLLVLTGVGLLPLFFKDLRLFPAYGGSAFLIFVSTNLLPLVEAHRPYRQIGAEIRKLDPGGKLRTYEVGKFHENLPFYAGRVILRGVPREGPAILLTPEVPEGCEVLKSYKVYAGSESRFFKFVRDIKRGKNFSELHLCIFDGGG